jgi:hypothetical protein
MSKESNSSEVLSARRQDKESMRRTDLGSKQLAITSTYTKLELVYYRGLRPRCSLSLSYAYSSHSQAHVDPTSTCTCNAPKFHSCHLYKHLVRAVKKPPAKFWTEVVCQRTLPLYQHPALVPRGRGQADYMEPADGSITDGDDHAWSANPEILAGGVQS